MFNVFEAFFSKEVRFNIFLVPKNSAIIVSKTSINFKKNLRFFTLHTSKKNARSLVLF